MSPSISSSGLNRPYIFYNIDAIFVTLADTGKYLSCASLQVRSAMRKYKDNLVVELKLSCQHCQTLSHTTGSVIDELLVLRVFITRFLRGAHHLHINFFKRSATPLVEWGH
jgi:hypothetical protein